MSISGAAVEPVSLTPLALTAETAVLKVYILVVVLLLLLSPVLVELVDLHCCVTLLKQVKSLKQRNHQFEHVSESCDHLKILVKAGRQVGQVDR